MIQSLKPIHGISVGIWTSGKSSQRRRERAARQWRTAARMSKKAGSPGRWSYYWVLLSPRGTWWYLEMWLEESNEGELLNICADYCGDGIVKKKKKSGVQGLPCQTRLLANSQIPVVHIQPQLSSKYQEETNRFKMFYSFVFSRRDKCLNYVRLDRSRIHLASQEWTWRESTVMPVNYYRRTIYS